MKVDSKSKKAVIALVAAARRGDRSSCSKLLKAGAQVSLPGRDGRTALTAAVECECTEVVDLLLKHGAEPNWVISERDPFLPGHTALTIAARSGNKEIVQKLLAHGANVSFQKASGGTPLSYAASRGYEKIVRMLLKAGTQLTDHVMDGAVRNGHQVVVHTLLKAGANPNRPSQIKETLLSIACGNGHLGVAKVLLRFGADAEEAPRGLTPLMWAIIRGHDNVAHYLIRCGLSIERKDNGGRTSLHHAVANRRHAVVKSLVRAGANIRAKTSKGITPIAVARELKDELLMNLLQPLEAATLRKIRKKSSP